MATGAAWEATGSSIRRRVHIGLSGSMAQCGVVWCAVLAVSRSSGVYQGRWVLKLRVTPPCVEATILATRRRVLEGTAP